MYLSMYVSVYLSIICLLSTCLSVYLTLYLSICLSVNLSVCLSIYLIYLSIYLSVHLSVYFLSIYLPIYLSICSSNSLSIYQSIYLSIYLFIFLPIYPVCLPVFLNLSVYLSFCLSMYQSIYLSIYLSVHRFVYPSICLHICLCLPIYLSICLSLSICLFLDSSKSKNGPTLWCFYRFDFDICFAPQQRALFRALNFQKCSEAAMFLPFWLRNVLRASTVCNFWSPSWPDISAPAALASLLFDPPEPRNIGKNTMLRDFSTFSRAWIFFLRPFSSLIFFTLLFSSLTLPISAFHLSIVSEVWLLNVLRMYVYIDQ